MPRSSQPEHQTALSAWWGDFELTPGRTVGWRLGDVDLRVRSDENEWQVQQLEATSPMTGTPDWAVVHDAELADSSEARLDRFVFETESSHLRITPSLADRAVVTSPRVPTHLLPGQSATLFVGTPIWVRVEVQDPPVVILEVPTRRASDTWFGPSRLEGELCYASTSRAVQQLDNVGLTTIWAATPLRVENRSAKPLLITRIKLPVRSLSLFASEEGRLWTNPVTMRQSEGETVELDVASSPPEDGGPVRLIQEPRAPEELGLLSRAFFGLFEGFGRDE